MSDEKAEAHNAYLKHLVYKGENIGVNDVETLRYVRENLERTTALIMQFLCQCRPSDRFRFNEFSNIIIDSSTMDGFEPEKAMHAFLNLEQYIILLFLMPWKQEFHRIKKFGGFYQSKIESHLRNAEIIFKLIGFTEMTTGLFVLTHSTKTDILQYVAFECLVASVECKIIADIWHKVNRRKLSIAEVVKIRFQNSGSSEKTVELIDSKFAKDKRDKISPHNLADGRASVSHVEKKVSLASANSPTATFRDKLQAHMNVARKISSPSHSDIPFMDDDTKETEYQPGNFDDHLMASLQIVGDKHASPVAQVENNSAGMRASQEWSFVREGLEKNYGKKYFEGQRKDILVPEKNKNEEDLIRTEPPYVQVLAKGVYENIDNTGKNMMFKPNVKTPPGYVEQPMMNNVIRSVAGDSDYVSGANTSIYPPTVHDHRSGTTTDTVINSSTQSNTLSRKAKTEPIARRSDGHGHKILINQTEPIARRTEAHFNKIPINQTYPSKGQLYGDKNVPDNMENIRTLQKRSSLPIVTNEKVPVPVALTRPSAMNSNIGNRQNPASLIAPTRTRGASGFDSEGRNSVIDNVSTKSAKTTPINSTPINGNMSSRKWACSHCTFYNTTANVICEMCSRSREGALEMDSPTIGYTSKICGKCTLENEINSIVCHACGNQLKGSQTVV